MKADRDKAILMLKTCRGQIDAVLKMMQDGRYCIDVANQILAAEALLRKANKLILKQHMESCVKTAFYTGDAEEKLQEVLDLMNKIMK